MDNEQHEFDIIIVGAGLVGTSLLLALQQQGLRIAVLEKHLPAFTTSSEASFRPISLAYGSMQIFRTLGVWEAIAQQVCPITEVQVCQQGILGGLHFTAREMAVDALGYVVPFAQLQRVLYQHAAQLAGVQIMPINALCDIVSKPNGAILVVDTAVGQRTLTAGLVIGCDGAQSRVRQLLGIKAKQKESTAVALTATLTLADDYVGCAIERFTPQDVLAILPLPMLQQCGLVLTMSSAVAEARSHWSQVEWLMYLNQALLGRLPPITAFQAGGTFPLQTVVAAQQISAHAMLLGNAAHTIYPLAAQGFNLGLRDVAALAEVLVTAKQQVQPLGANAVLQQYVAWRSADQQQIIRLTAGIAQGFALQVPGIPVLRGLGLLAVDMLPWLRKRVARMTMGLAGQLPKLVRGIPLWE